MAFLIWTRISLGHFVKAGTESLPNSQHGLVVYDGMLWGETANGEWFTNADIYQSGNGLNDTSTQINPNQNYLLQFPVLAYHDFDENDDGSDPYRMSFNEFTNQLDMLKELGYTVISVKQAYQILLTNNNNLGKVVVLTFDDGYTSWEKIADILAARNLPATFFWIGNNVTGQSDVISKIQATPNLEIGNHTTNHLPQGTGNYWGAMECVE